MYTCWRFCLPDPQEHFIVYWSCSSDIYVEMHVDFLSFICAVCVIRSMKVIFTPPSAKTKLVPSKTRKVLALLIKILLNCAKQHYACTHMIWYDIFMIFALLLSCQSEFFCNNRFRNVTKQSYRNTQNSWHYCWEDILHS